MNKHTPGPWTKREHMINVYPILSPKGAYIAEVSSWREDPEDVQAEAEANANLIAASPIMYQFIAKEAEQGNPEAQQLMEMIDATSQQSNTRHTD